ncbi:exonuclease SbcCD subunit D [Blastococcus sp. Marseille-P5729]|uniref:exonuclease SbcCD subunit D n=1 Tax=Blastococcus sp. Marseille-P5729 TaxID=2086582 RepID=UPI000D10AB25|nr:exonuclease SbcCD subunit D [Blastococcus sp. Marseille-P5729]
MRILHTSDWHVGRRFNETEVLDLLGEVLAALVETVRREQVDVVVIAGDVFDRAAPSAEAVAFLSDQLRQVREAGAQIVMISGNHDGASRLGYGGWAAAAGGLHVITTVDQIGRPVELADEHGPVCFYGIPFLDPKIDRGHFGDDELHSHELILDAAMDRVRDDLAERDGARSVVLAHCFAVDGDRGAVMPGAADIAGEITDSMRSIACGGVECAPTAVFEGPTYVALGHLHSRKTLSDRIRYSGSPLAYSFGDHGPRGAWLIDLDESGIQQVTWAELPVPRGMSVITGRLDELLSDPAYDAVVDHWISAVLTDPVYPLEAMRRLRERFANCVRLELRPDSVPGQAPASYAERVRGKSDEELTAGFIAEMRGGVEASELESELIREAYEALRAQEARA